MESAVLASLRQHIQATSHQGRPLSELLKTNEILKGVESQRLRTFFTSQCMEPGRDLDAYGISLAKGDLAQVKADFARRVARHAAVSPESPVAGPSTTEAPTKLTPEAAAAQELYRLTWGPTRVPIYGLLGVMRIIYPERGAQHFAVARWLIQTAKVPVNAPDLSGTLAISHAISTKPGLDTEYGQLLFDAGGDLNNRNRYGGTAAHEISQIWTPKDPAVSVDIADSDGMVVRYMAARLKTSLNVPGLVALIAASDRDRAARTKQSEDGGRSCCALGGRDADETMPMKRCGRCKVARYCDPVVRGCQKADWPHHKKNCVKVVDLAEGFSFLGTKFWGSFLGSS
ncbi:hypothetical protein DFH08DRAFT_1084470 [Mycena albidolilacea]|uniref:MYND-type domain-containing protein n=1 Tax=Mycena albidolilacea TaxID=1033008 RepID=A0AAD7EJ58_9AGAR|nr:hypothetical protein DFH08DRAFT_1084470 [Mycena albidolilacea]